MLSQIPSSAPALFSLSPSLASLFLVAQVVVPFILSSLSAPKKFISATPSRTIEIILAPTKCDLSSSPIAFPYVAAMGFAAFIFASLFCILRAKGFFARPHPANPSPPPAPDSNSSAQKVSQRSPWLWLLLLILALMAFGIFAALLYRDYKVKFKVPAPVSALVKSCVQRLSAFEGGFREGCGVIASYISTMVRKCRWQYFKTLLLAFTGHCLGLLIVFTHRKLRPRVLDFARFHCVPSTSVLVPIAVVCSFSQLSWIPWINYCLLWGLRWLPDIRSIHESILRFLSRTSPTLDAMDSVDIWMIFGPFAVHAAVMCLGTVAIVLVNVPSETRVMVRQLWDLFLLYFCAWILNTAVLYGVSIFMFSHLRLSVPPPYVRPSRWETLSCPPPQICWLVDEQFADWKVGQIQDFYALRWDLQRLFWVAVRGCYDTWGMLDCIQKSFIVAPAAIFYGHFYIVHLIVSPLIPGSSSRRCPPLASFCWRYGTGSVDMDDLYTLFLLSHLHGSVENRLAAATRQPGKVPKAAPNTDTARQERTRRDKHEAAGAAMGIVGDALLFSPPASLLPPSYSSGALSSTCSFQPPVSLRN
ncbi:hypothetical protein B0H11DRAFT_2426364 [Mycena galericulata]|nr:hypothetical protein B0H11DRAFT_2426364 [Mycena galericulata]